MSTSDNTITAQVMNNIDQLYTAHGQGIQPLYDEDSGKTPAFTYNNVVSAINDGYLPVYVESIDNGAQYLSITGWSTDSTNYDVYFDMGNKYSASDPDNYLEGEVRDE